MEDSHSEAQRRRHLAKALLILAVCAAAVIAIVVAVNRAQKSDDLPRNTYAVTYTVGFDPAAGLAEVSIEVVPGYGSMRQARFRMPEARYTDITGDGQISRDGDIVSWVPERDRPQTLRYKYAIDVQHGNGGYDAHINADWVIVRGDDLVPPATVKATKGTDANARLRFDLPEGWTSAETPYRRDHAGEAFVVVNSNRNFDRPRGWIIAGKVAARRDTRRGTMLSVAAPLDSGARRMDTLAFLNVILPEARKAFGELPPKLLVVSAGDPMWRGGLSGPRSLFLHADRPLVSENGTSTLTHEMVHVLTGLRGAAGDDWIAEGLAEYYAIELMRRADLLDKDRAEDTHAWMKTHGAGISTLHAERSSGDRTARAVQLFHELDAEIRKESGGDQSLDDLVRALMDKDQVDTATLKDEAKALLGQTSKVLGSSLLD